MGDIVKDHPKHVFNRWAGGTNTMDNVSDDAYDCACGAQMRITNQVPEHHLALPGVLIIELAHVAQGGE